MKIYIGAEIDLLSVLCERRREVSTKLRKTSLQATWQEWTTTAGRWQLTTNVLQPIRRCHEFYASVAKN